MPAGRRTWLISPAVTTALFVLAQCILAALSEGPRQKIAAATAEAPSLVPVQVRVVTQIHRFEESSRPLAPVPESEAQLFDLLRRNGCVVFSADEVEALGTQATLFDAEEIEVIRPSGDRHRLRSYAEP